MPVRLRRSDLEPLSDMAEYRVLTTAQITALRFLRKRATLRRLAQLVETGLVSQSPRGLGRTKGRSEKRFMLEWMGFEVLLERGLLSPKAEFRQASAENIQCVDHELLVGWFRIHLLEIERVLSRVSVDFVLPRSVFVQENVARLFPLRIDESVEDEAGSYGSIVPDGVFRTRESEQNKSLLFFLEVDLGTEPLASPGRNANDLRQKVLNYRALILSDRSPPFDRVWNCSFGGFRLPFLTNTAERMGDLCRLVREMPPSNFIWIADQQRMFSRGLADTIWARGRDLARPAESILGWGMARPSPIPPIQS